MRLPVTSGLLPVASGLLPVSILCITFQLQHRNALSGQEMALNIINSDWEEILEGIKPLMNGNTHLDQAPGSPLMKSAPVEARWAQIP